MKNKYLLSIADAAECLGIGKQRLRELCYTDPTMPKIKIGSHTKINMPLMEEWINKKTLEGKTL